MVPQEKLASGRLSKAPDSMAFSAVEVLHAAAHWLFLDDLDQLVFQKLPEVVGDVA
jgi:hypothetical protein